ncbi:hypothetical protein ABHI18_004383 [Aspergillus niger]
MTTTVKPHQPSGKYTDKSVQTKQKYNTTLSQIRTMIPNPNPLLEDFSKAHHTKIGIIGCLATVNVVSAKHSHMACDRFSPLDGIFLPSGNSW